MNIGQKKILGLVFLVGGLALCGVGLWLLLSPAQYAATARIKIEMDESYEPSLTRPNSPIGYDPYFIPTTFEVIQSQLVLGRVVTNLNLNNVWSDKHFKGAQLNTPKTIEIIKSKMSLEPVRNTRLLTITFHSDDPKEAAQLANAVAVAYCDYRLKSRAEMIKKGLEILQGQYQTEEKLLQEIQARVNGLRRQYSITNNFPTAEMVQAIQSRKSEQVTLLPGQLYWAEKKQLDDLTTLHKLLASKIEAEKLDMQIPKHPIVLIVDRAELPQFPVSTYRYLGAALLAIALFPLLGGILLLKSARQPAV